jgi:hypothetical protein
MRAAAPPTTPPTMAPVWLCFIESGLCTGEAAVEFGGSVKDIDELESVSEDEYELVCVFEDVV